VFPLPTRENATRKRPGGIHTKFGANLSREKQMNFGLLIWLEILLPFAGGGCAPRFD
jgi:hypothetical protein